MAKSGILEQRQYNYTDIRPISLYSTTVTYLASKAIEFGEKCKIRAITPFTVIQGHQGRYQSKARMPLHISAIIRAETSMVNKMIVSELLFFCF